MTSPPSLGLVMVGGMMVDPSQPRRAPSQFGERKSRIAQHVVGRDQPVRDGKHAEVLQILAQRGAHIRQISAGGRGVDQLLRETEHAGLVRPGLEMEMQCGLRLVSGQYFDRAAGDSNQSAQSQ